LLRGVGFRWVCQKEEDAETLSQKEVGKKSGKGGNRK